eukprot:scaffold618_cov130-Cylindrotheca_fusiformis.AAC.1
MQTYRGDLSLSPLVSKDATLGAKAGGNIGTSWMSWPRSEVDNSGLTLCPVLKTEDSWAKPVHPKWSIFQQ